MCAVTPSSSEKSASPTIVSVAKSIGDDVGVDCIDCSSHAPSANAESRTSATLAKAPKPKAARVTAPAISNVSNCGRLVAPWAIAASTAAVARTASHPQLAPDQSGASADGLVIAPRQNPATPIA